MNGLKLTFKIKEVMKKINVRVGDTINVDVCQPKFGKYPIGRFNGMVCKLTLLDNIKRLEYGCTIEAVVLVVNEKYLCVLVERVIVSAGANNMDFLKSIDKLNDKYKLTKQRV